MKYHIVNWWIKLILFQGKYRYFQKREEWKVTDVLFNPMVMMMVLPLLLVTVLPKMMQDPDTKKEMEEIQAKMNVQNNINMPEVKPPLKLFKHIFHEACSTAWLLLERELARLWLPLLGREPLWVATFKLMAAAP